MPEYVELHAHSNFSFLEGASHPHELLLRARELGYPALALTDHDNLCGAMRFAQQAGDIGIRPITGAEVTLTGGGHVTLLAATPDGYSNLTRLLSHAHEKDRLHPALDPALLGAHAAGLVLLSGCRQSPLVQALEAGRQAESNARAAQWREWFGDRLYLEVQRHLVRGDLPRVRRLAALGKELAIPLVATNNVHYHVRERARLQDCLIAIDSRKSLEAARPNRRPNDEYHLKSAGQMARLFREFPVAVRNTLAIAERCAFDLTKHLTYQFPSYDVPEGFTEQTYLEHLCWEVAHRRYNPMTAKVEARLREEFRLIRKHKLAGFLLLYREIIHVAHEVQIDLGLVDRETPVEEAPPGRGRGSSVALVVGYLIGISHIDPMQYDLGLERFLPEDLASVPDIDLDFPRNIREELIKRIHAKYGWQRAALTGMVATYRIKGAIRDLGLALNLPDDQLDKLATRVEHAPAKHLRGEMEALPEFRDKVDAPGWRDLIAFAAELDAFPHHLAQHPGGMVISSSPLIYQVPVRPSAISDRYVMDWDKDDVDSAGMVKIDFLALGVLSQLQEATRLVEQRTGQPCDLSRIDYADNAVYDMMGRGDTIGIFQVESAAQGQTIIRIKPRNLVDMAHEVAAVRPGVGVNHGVSEYIRRRNGEPWNYDHPLEQHALERTLGVILFQDQVNQLAMDVAGFSSLDADKLRRSFLKRGNEPLVLDWWRKFVAGAQQRGVDHAAAATIFAKFNGQYMFPESHAFAFGITAYQGAWMKHYHPLEFFVGLFNQQPMGFYNLESLKQDARKHGIRVLHPNVNASGEWATVDGEAIRLGLLHVGKIGPVAGAHIVRERGLRGPYVSLGDFMGRTGLLREPLEHLASAGALDAFAGHGYDRRSIQWEIGLRYVPLSNGQAPLKMPVEYDLVSLPSMTAWEVMEEEYRTMGLHPDSHLMAYLHSDLAGVMTSEEVAQAKEGQHVTVAGLIIRRQRPLAKAVFMSAEDELGITPLVVWPKDYDRLRQTLKEPVLIVDGVLSRRDGTLNVVVTEARAVVAVNEKVAPKSKNWG